MSEVTFAKTFLATLDKKPIKLPADHVSDPRKYAAQSPFVLPRQTHPFPRKGPIYSGQHTKNKTVTATLKPMKGGETITISDLTLQSTIHDVKTQYAQKSGQPQDKIKLLLNKKPAADLKTLSDLGVEGETVELTVMLMGGAGLAMPSATTPAVEKSEAAAISTPTTADADNMDIDSTGPAAPASEKAQAEAEMKPEAQQNTVQGMLASEEFWSDLQGFLAQRLRDEFEGQKLAKLFREAHGKR
ncbi:hypothetical protein LTR62_007013 [Meristemomyces frigidus]|uniref:Ubiquitin-like domain-containing protein n=1 Tax=Meristemomyces frigidus TaxID=1508187 RepID=A0AAN7TJD9_9PEZI|nr:hypothetical protein LTR62_007013 [Meristemomyces frigidus]